MSKKHEPLNRVIFEPEIRHVRDGQTVSFNDCIEEVVNDFFSTPLVGRLEKLHQRTYKKDGFLGDRLKMLADEVRNADYKWAAIGAQDFIAKSIDTDIELALCYSLRALLYLMMIERLVGGNFSPMKYQEHMRLAASLPPEKLAETDKFLKDLWRHLYEGPRKKWMNITPGGSKSELSPYAHALCFHYERLHPIWKEAKKLYKTKGGNEEGVKAVKEKFKELGKGERWTISEHFIGLPDELIRKLEPNQLKRKPKPTIGDGKEYDSSPEYIAYEHAAYLCQFKIGAHSVRQIKRICTAHKRMMGTEYYNQTFKRRDTHL